ncbi:MAG: DNA adenine methylase [Tannerellaceae bacterium]|jgi:DNA adenine methylase|nr:DNA adenine methylase [Tannerellaceae bacterium]
MKKKECVKIELKTPITYYGGKQQMLRHILPLIPKHRIYVEPFFGGGAVFWGKEPAKVEFINDHDGEVINFYRVLKLQFPELKKRD